MSASLSPGDGEEADAPSPSTRGRGRGKSRGGLGKYLRARGRGRGRGRPAEWGQRLVLEDEREVELEEEERKEIVRKFARRQLASNADRYLEPNPELDSDGEEIVEPEVDLSAFFERQRLASEPSPAPPPDEDDDDVDTSLARLIDRGKQSPQSKKGRVQQIEWDEELEEMSREKAAAEATRDLKSRFRAQAAKQRGRPVPRGAATSTRGRHHQDRSYTEAPPLPTDDKKPDKSEKQEMQDFLDSLLN